MTFDSHPSTLIAMCIASAAAANSEMLVRLDRRAEVIGEFVGMDALADLALRVCTQLLAGIDHAARKNAGLVIGTEFGCMETDRAFDRSRREAAGRFASPAAFSRTLPSTVPAEISLRFALRGPSLVLTAGAGSTSLALRRAVRWMSHFNLDYCIAGGMDWVSVGQPAKESCSVALVLLAKHNEASSDAHVRLDPSSATDADDSRASDLDRLGDWIRQPRPLFLGNGVHLSPPTAAIHTDGQ